jgi:DNA-binding IclR family transcriptional regulator
VASLELLEALSQGANTVTTIATALGISRAEAARQLSAATASGLVYGRTTTVT